MNHELSTNRIAVVIFMSLVCLFFTTSCGDKLSQCQQIIQIANRVVKETKDFTLSEKPTETELTDWLQAAKIMEKAANDVKSLRINDVQLINYQADFVDLYKINSQATHEIIQARQNKDIFLAKSAQEKAKKASNLEEKLSSQFNSYCQSER
jgi:hypothetical protein